MSRPKRATVKDIDIDIGNDDIDPPLIYTTAWLAADECGHITAACCGAYNAC